MKDIHFLAQVIDVNATNLQRHRWRNGKILNLPANLIDHWNHCMEAWVASHIHISDHVNELIWDKVDSGGYTPKAGYIYLNVDLHQREPCQWWKCLWKLHYPANSKILSWEIIEKKEPNWELLQRKLYQGLGWCYLCKDSDEILDHIFFSYPFTQQIWDEALRVLEFHLKWNVLNFKNVLQSWVMSRETKQFMALPLIIAQGVCISRNKQIC